MAEPGRRSDVFSALVVITFVIFLIGIGIAALEWTAYEKELPRIESRVTQDTSTGPPETTGGGTVDDRDDTGSQPDEPAPPAGGGDDTPDF